MTRHELESALIAAGWERIKCPLAKYTKGNKLFVLYNNLFTYTHNNNFHELAHIDCRLIEVPLKDGTTYRAIVCDTLDGLFIRVEL